MLSFSPAIRFFVYTPPTDMRKQFNGLYALVTQSMDRDVMTGDYFVFFNRRQNRCKILYWDRDGLAMWAKKKGARLLPDSDRPGWCKLDSRRQHHTGNDSGRR